MESKHKLDKVTAAGVLVAFGIIYGDIGTSPLYVMQAIILGEIITQEIIYGAISCIFWTLTLQIEHPYATHWTPSRQDCRRTTLFAAT